MSIFLDTASYQFKGELWCHMMTDGTTDELLNFAKQLGLRPNWIQKKNTPYEHFDLSPSIREKAVTIGAIEISSKEMVKHCIRKRQAVQAIVPLPKVDDNLK